MAAATHPDAKLMAVFFAVKVTNEIYWTGTPADDALNRVSVENLQAAAREYTGLEICTFSVPAVGGRVRGWVERFAENANIYVQEGQSEEWQRFVIAKELCHLLVDKSEAEMSTDVVSTLTGLVAFDSFDLFSETSPIRVSEKVAEIGALELIYPFEYRESDAELVRNGTKSIAQLSEERGVPEVWVLRGLDSKFIDACKAIWHTIDVFTRRISQPHPSAGSDS